MGDRDDPAAIRSLAVATEDVVDAFVYTRENPGEAVLRVTPPFHGRMRARLHVVRGVDDRATGTIHVPPADLLADEVVDAYPTLEAVAADLEGDGDEREASPIRSAHREAVAEWRERAEASVVDAADLEIGGERRRLSIATLG